MNATLTAGTFFGSSPANSLRRGALFAAVFMLMLAAGAQSIRAQFQQPPPRGAAHATTPLASDESESDDEEVAVRPRVTDPAAVMRAARVIIVHSKSAFVNETEVEDSLRKRKEFRAWGLALTRNDAEADLVIEINRKALTRRFTFTVLDPRTMLVVTSGKTRSVLFGKKIPNKIAEKFMNRLKTVRPLPGA
ncbi:MAG TPA: hypothetical protein VM934_15305 [Pyrinomonadaceae bacterium]|jgi:hypothetical protein|nr:hypothetical protein [Pyrinomonadaceae bacterium]